MGKAAYATGLVFLWAGALCLGLETFAVVYTGWLDSHNPFILTSLGKPCPLPKGIPTSTPQISLLRDSRITWFSQAAPPPAALQAIDWRIPQLSETPSRQEARRELFPRLSEEERTLFAMLNGEVVVSFDLQANLRDVYTVWFMSRNIAWSEHTWVGRLARALKLGETWKAAKESVTAVARSNQPRTVLLAFPGFATPIKFFFLPDLGASRVHVFVKMDSFLQVPKNLPADSPWEIPFFRYKNNVRDAHSGTGQPQFATNNFGFRGRDIALPKPPHTFRIICIGGSTTEEGLGDEATYPSILEKELRRIFATDAIEVINCGVSGLATTTHLMRFAEYLHLEPDLLVAYEGVNDLAFNLPLLWEVTGGIPLHLLRHSTFLRRFLPGLFYPGKHEREEAIRRGPLENLDVMHMAAALTDVRLALCSIAAPDYARMEAKEWQYYDHRTRTHWRYSTFTARLYCEMAASLNRGIRDLCARNGMLCIPVGENLTGGWELFGDICHMKGEGPALKARIVAEALKDYIAPAIAALK